MRGTRPMRTVIHKDTLPRPSPTNHFSTCGYHDRHNRIQGAVGDVPPTTVPAAEGLGIRYYAT